MAADRVNPVNPKILRFMSKESAERLRETEFFRQNLVSLRYFLA